jgi:hypothetical protein
MVDRCVGLSVLRQPNKGTERLRHRLSDGAAFAREGRADAAIRFQLQSARLRARHLLLRRVFHDEKQEQQVRELAGRTCFVSIIQNECDTLRSRVKEFFHLRLHRCIHLDERWPRVFEGFARQLLCRINAEFAARFACGVSTHYAPRITFPAFSTHTAPSPRAAQPSAGWPVCRPECRPAASCRPSTR